MARPLRLEFSGALYHVTARGNRQEAIYEDDTDRETFISIFNAFEHTLGRQGPITIRVEEHELFVTNQVNSNADGLNYQPRYKVMVWA